MATSNIVERTVPNSVVKKHNVLIEARHAKLLDVRAVRLIAQAAARITIKDQDFQIYKIPVKAITSSPDVYNRTADNSFVIDKITDQLVNSVIRIPRKDKDGKKTGKSFTKYAYFAKCEYIAGTGYVELQFHPDLKDYFLQLKNNFTQLSLEILCSLPSTYSYRLYELLKQYTQGGIFKRAFLLSDLMDMIGVKPGPKSSYRKYPKFRQKVLLPAQKNFEKYTDLLFEFNAWADHGRQYTHIEFFMKKNQAYSRPLFDLKKEMEDDSIIPPPSLPPEIRSLIPKGQWGHKINGCEQVCNEIINRQGLESAVFYVKHAKSLNDQKERASWGKTIRAAWKSKLYEQHLKDTVDQKERELFQRKKQNDENKKAEEKRRLVEQEKEQIKSNDRIINQILSSDKKEQFENFVKDNVKEHENKIMSQRFNQNKGSTRRMMYQKYFESYLTSLLISK